MAPRPRIKRVRTRVLMLGGIAAVALIAAASAVWSALPIGAGASAPVGRISQAAALGGPYGRPVPPDPPTAIGSEASSDLTTGFDATPPSSAWTRPPLLDSRLDPAYGTPVRRMTSADGTRFDRNTYSRREAENADGTMLMSYHGDAAYRVYDRSTGDLVRTLDVHPDGEPQWHPTDPTLIRHIAGSNASLGDLTYLQTDVATGDQRTIADLTGVMPTCTSTSVQALTAAG